MRLSCSRRPVGDVGVRSAAAVALALRIAKRLQKTALVGSLILSCATTTDAISLDAALATTLEKNPEIVQARTALEHAAGRRLVFRSVALPDLKIQGVAGVQGGDRADEPGLRPFAFARGFFTQPIFDAALPASLRRGDIEILLAQQRLNVAVVGQLHAARIAF